MNICQFKPYLGEDEFQNIKLCFDSNWITEGPKAKEFIEKLCKFVGSKYGVLAPNGTLALYLALVSIGIKSGDEVIVPDLTFIATANAVIMCGAKPIFCDIDEDLHIDTQQCNKLITQNTKAIIPVHLYGRACNMNNICDFAKHNNLLIIEDAAQAIGVSWNNKHCGTFGDLGCFSFFADKTITTGEGGFICTDNPDLHNKLLYLRNQGRINRGSFIHPQIGYNFRMTDIQCAIGLVQLDKFEYIKSKKIEILKRYRRLLCNNVCVLSSLKESNYIPFRVVIQMKEDGVCTKLTEYLTKNTIEIRSLFYPLSLQPCFNTPEYKNDVSLLRSKYYYDRCLCLPSYPTLTEQEIDYVCNTINNFFKLELNV